VKRDVGNGVVRDLLLTGRSINATKALANGLASQSPPKGSPACARATPRSYKIDRATAQRRSNLSSRFLPKSCPRD